VGEDTRVRWRFSVKSLVLNRLGVAVVAFTALLAFCPHSPTAAFAQWDDDAAKARPHRERGISPFAAPELDITTAAQGLVLIGGALVLTRRHRRKQ